MDKKRVFLVDDHGIARMGLRRLIESEPAWTVCGEAEDAESALAALPRAKADVLVADVGLPGMSGLELVKRVRERFPRTEVLVVSMYDEGVYAERALKVGAKGYLMKRESAEQILDALRRVAEGKRWMSPAMTEKLMGRLTEGDDPARSEPVDRLSDRELDVFRCVGEGLKASEVADRLHLSVKTVESYREQIKTKLGLDSASALARYAVAWAKKAG